MSVNLLRNSKVFFTTHVELTDPDRGKIRFGGHNIGGTQTTFEIQVLDDLSFNQTTAVETIAVNEAGTKPIRGQRQFNTALNPVDFNFSTYLRPAKVGSIGGVVAKISASTNLGVGAATNFRGWDTGKTGGIPDTWGSTLQDAYNLHNGTAAGQAISTNYGPRTTVEVALPNVTGAKPLILAPIFGTAQFLPGTTAPNPTFEKLLGFRIVDGGEGYSAGATLTVDVFDPDFAPETGETITISIDAVGGATPVTAGQKISCEERHLWNAMFSPDQPYTVATSFTNGVGQTDGAFKEADPYVRGNPATVELIKSNSHQLQRFGMIVVFDQNTFLLDDCSLTQASIDFGIDQIATIQWSGQARAVRRCISPTMDFTTGTFGTPIGGVPPGQNTISGFFSKKITEGAPFIANKLSTVTLSEHIGEVSTAATRSFISNATMPSPKHYTIPITAGNITLQNNITYLTPAYMGAVNQAVTYFTGSRNVTGSLTAYLRSGSGALGTAGPNYAELTAANNFTANLFSDLVDKVNTDSDPEFALQIEIGGRTNDTRVELAMPAVVLTIPTINAESVITSAINFTAQGSDSANKIFDILKDNEITIKYFV